jgi:hypothetical protein
VTLEHVGLDLSALAAQLERHALIVALQLHPEWTLGDLLAVGGSLGETLRGLTLAELRAESPPMRLDETGLVMPIDQGRRARAEKLSGHEFDQVVLEIITEAGERRVASSYVVARSGGPRWKLQDSLNRLVDAGLVVRTGVTSSTRYRAAHSDRSDAS